MSKLRVGLALTGSYCTFEKTLSAMEGLRDKFDFTPIMSENAYGRDTRFGTAESWRERLTVLTGREIIHSVQQAEPIGPKGLFDLLLIAPCTGNTLSKLANGITDTCVTMAAKSHLRCGRPVLLALSTNDALSGSAANIGRLMDKKHVYFAPFYQDDAGGKPASLVTDYSRIEESILAAAAGRQVQPLLGKT